MAGILVNATTPAVALASATTKTVAMLSAPAQQRLLVKRIRFTFDGSAAADPGTVQVMRATTAGTMTDGASRLARVSAGSETLQATWTYNATVEPTKTDVLEILYADRGYEVFYPLGMELIVQGGTRIAVVATFGSALNASVLIAYEE